MAAILESVGSVVTQCITWVQAFVGCITSTPLLLLFVSIPLVGYGIGLLRRLIRV